MNFKIKEHAKNMLFIGLQSQSRVIDMPDKNLSYRTPMERVLKLALYLMRDKAMEKEGILQLNYLPIHYSPRNLEGIENLLLPTPQKVFNIERNKGERATLLLQEFNDWIYPQMSKFIEDDDIVILTGDSQMDALRRILQTFKDDVDKYRRHREKIAELEAQKKGVMDVEKMKSINSAIRELESHVLERPSFQSFARLVRERTYSFRDGISMFLRTLKPVMFLHEANMDIGIFRVSKQKYSHTPTVEEILEFAEAVEESGKLLADRIDMQVSALTDEKIKGNLREFGLMKLKAYKNMLDVEELMDGLGEEWKNRLETIFINDIKDSSVVRQMRCLFALIEFLSPISSFKFRIRGLQPNMKDAYSLSELYTMEYEPLTSAPELEAVAANVIDSGLKPFVAPNPYTTAAMLASGLLEKSHTSKLSEVERDNIELDDIGTGDAGTLRFSMMKTETSVKTISHLPTGEQVLTEETKRSYVPVCSVFVPVRLELDVFNVQQD